MTPDGYSHYVAIPGVIQFVDAGAKAQGGAWTGIMADGFISDHDGYCVIGGDVEDVEAILKDDYRESMSLAGAVQLGRKALDRGSGSSDPLPAEHLEVCLLSRRRSGRKFERLSTGDLNALL